MSAVITTEQIESAIGELLREQQVRHRCYPKWVAEGKQLNKYEARQRLDALGWAIKACQLYLEEVERLKDCAVPFAIVPQEAASA